MKRYRDFKPTAFDTHIPFGDERDDWFITPIIRTRDNSNGSPLRSRTLERIDPTGKDHEIHRFKHWAVGWFEIIIVKPGTRSAEHFEKKEGDQDVP